MNRIPVLDHGWVELEEMMGGDQAIIDAARICYGSESKGPKSDKRLIERLVTGRIKHNTPIEHCVFRLRVKCPIFVARQWLRHRIGTFNERSLRYCLADQEYYIPESLNIFDRDVYQKAINHSFQTYRNLVAQGRPRELCRAVLPLAIYTEFIWTVNAWSLINWLTKRLDKAAQVEHREYAKAIWLIFTDNVPILARAIQSQVWEGGRDGNR